MPIHVLDENTFFQTSVPVGSQQRLLLSPSDRPVAAGDELFLRDVSGNITWVAEVLATGDSGSPMAWNRKAGEGLRYVFVAWLAKIHPGTVPLGRSRLVAPWVTLNSRTLAAALPWREKGTLVYHHTLRLVEGILTAEEFSRSQELGCIAQHPSGHWFIPLGDARKRLLVQVRGWPLVCVLCGQPIASLEEATVDHRLPSSQGGPDFLGNLQLAHKPCNEAKGNSLPEQYQPFFALPQPGASGSSRWTRRRPAKGRSTRSTKRGTTSAARTPAAPAPAVPAPAVPPPAASASVPSTVTAAHVPSAFAANVPGAQTAAQVAAAAAPPPSTQAPAAPAQTAAPAQAPAQTPAASASETVPAVPEEWLATVQSATWSEFAVLAAGRGWAAKTATLRTMEQLRRNQSAAAAKEAVVLVEHSGRKGRFSLLGWKDKTLLLEERNGRRHWYQVRTLNCLSPAAYTWYLSQFGRTAPLVVASALLGLWQAGRPDGEGRIIARKGEDAMVLQLQDDRLLACATAGEGDAVA